MRENKLPKATQSPVVAGASMLLLLCASFSHAQATPATGTRQMPDPAQVHSSAIVIDGTPHQPHNAPHTLTLYTPADQIIAAHSQGKFAVLMGIEGGHSIEDSLALLRDYFRLGVRYMTLTWSNTNNWADSSGDIEDPSVHHHDGLTPFRKQLVQEMNRLGMMVDISHA